MTRVYIFIVEISWLNGSRPINHVLRTSEDSSDEVTVRFNQKEGYNSIGGVNHLLSHPSQEQEKHD
jgi:hypothetical protein